MQKVTLITGLKKELVQKIPGREYVEYHCFNPEKMMYIDGSDDVLVSDTIHVNKIAAPIIHIFHRGRDDVYFAYSEEVEEYLGIPIRLIIKDNEKAHDDLLKELQRLTRIAKRINGYGFLKRLRYLVTGRMEESSWS